MTESWHVNDADYERPPSHVNDLKRAINAALIERAPLEGRLIGATMDAGEATLRGTVRTWAERSQAERACWASQGITAVNNNQLLVTFTA